MKTVFHDGVRWEVDRERAGELEAWLRAPRDGARILRENRYRTVTAGEGSIPGGWVLKETRALGWARRLKAMIGLGAAREWERARILAAMGGLSPRPVAFGRGEGRALLLMERFPGTTLDEFLRGPYEALPEARRRAFLGRVARFLRALEERGVESSDLHSGNVLVDPDAAGAERLALVDAAPVRFRGRFPVSLRLAQTARLLAACGSLSPKERVRAAIAWCQAAKIPPGERKTALRRLDAEIRRLWQARWRSRTARCLVDSGSFAVERGWARSVYRRRELESAWVEEAIRAAEEALNEARNPKPETRNQRPGPRVKKNAPESAIVAGLEGPWPGRICVKRFRSRDLPMLLSQVGLRARGVRAWVAANGLVSREAGTARPLALVAEGWGPWRGRAWLVMEDLSAKGLELDRALCRAGWRGMPEHERRRWIGSLARELRSVHWKGIRLADAKTCNLFVMQSPESWVLSPESEGGRPHDFQSDSALSTQHSALQWFWVDVDGVRFPGVVDPLDRLQNLVQISCSTPRFVGDRERLRFFRIYAAGMRRAERRRLLRGVAEASRRQRILYVGPDGDVEEEWRPA